VDFDQLYCRKDNLNGKFYYIISLSDEHCMHKLK